MGQTLLTKVWNRHIYTENWANRNYLYIDLHLIQQVTSPQAFRDLGFKTEN